MLAIGGGLAKHCLLLSSSVYLQCSVGFAMSCRMGHDVSQAYLVAHASTAYNGISYKNAILDTKQLHRCTCCRKDVKLGGMYREFVFGACARAEQYHSFSNMPQCIAFDDHCETTKHVHMYNTVCLYTCLRSGAKSYQDHMSHMHAKLGSLQQTTYGATFSTSRAVVYRTFRFTGSMPGSGVI